MGVLSATQGSKVGANTLYMPFYLCVTKKCMDTRRMYTLYTHAGTTTRLRSSHPLSLQPSLCQMTTPSSRTTSRAGRYPAACRSPTTVFSKTWHRSCGARGQNLQTFLLTLSSSKAGVVVGGARGRDLSCRRSPESGAIELASCLLRRGRWSRPPRCGSSVPLVGGVMRGVQRLWVTALCVS